MQAFSDITAVILAAGESRRIGQPKPFLKLGDKTFVKVILERLRAAGAHSVVVVFNHAHRDQLQALSLSDCNCLLNTRPNLGQLYSLQLALRSLPASCPAILLCLVDHPSVRIETYRLLIEQSAEWPQKILTPTFQGRKGHPVVFPKLLFKNLLNVPLGLGAQQVVQEHPDMVLLLPVRDEGVVLDIDTPQEYLRIKEKYTNL
jgi:molybdenum cofactor cytidylyltransferase